MQNCFNGIYNNVKVLVTGHTGFKGSWMTYWLYKLGAKVTGYALNPPTQPNHFNLIQTDINSVIGNITDKEILEKSVKNVSPEIIFHLAAQPFVSVSYDNPYETYNSNVMGTLNILEAARKTNSVKAIVLITTDKVYENKEWIWGYKETDRLGGYDPYSSSKACCELLINSYRNSFFNKNNYLQTHQVLIASARAGNVIGGGDWGQDRLIPDIIKNAIQNKKALIRNPNSIRPWQHVLESISAYLLLGQKLLEKNREFDGSWNFGPQPNNDLSVKDIANLAINYWSNIQFELNHNNESNFHETNLLKLDSTKAFTILNWKPIWDAQTTIEKTISWYKAFYEDKTILTNEQLNEYFDTAKHLKRNWAK